GVAEQMVVAGEIDRQLLRCWRRRFARAAEADREIKLLRLPGTQPFFDLLRIPGGIGCGFERFVRENRGRLMVLAASAAGRREASDDIWTNGAYQPHVVAEDFIASPLFERLVYAEREAEVDRPSEVLLRTVESMDGTELFGPQHSERLEDLRTDLVLP